MNPYFFYCLSISTFATQTIPKIYHIYPIKKELVKECSPLFLCQVGGQYNSSCNYFGLFPAKGPTNSENPLALIWVGNMSTMTWITNSCNYTDVGTGNNCSKWLGKMSNSIVHASLLIFLMGSWSISLHLRWNVSLLKLNLFPNFCLTKREAAEV